MKNSKETRIVGIYGMCPIALLPIATFNELKVYIAGASFQGVSDIAFPSREALAKRSGLTVQAVSVAITGLIKKNWATRKRNYGKPNTYYFKMDTSSDESVKKENSEIKKKERAAQLRKNIQSSDSIGHPIESDNEHPIQSDNARPIESDNIVKEQVKDPIKRRRQITLPKSDLEKEFIEKVKRLVEENSSSFITYTLKNQEDLIPLLTKYGETLIPLIDKVPTHPKFSMYHMNTFIWYIKDFLYSEKDKGVQSSSINYFQKPKVRDGEYDGHSATLMSQGYLR